MNQKNIYRNTLGMDAPAMTYSSPANNVVLKAARTLLSLLFIGCFIQLPARAAESDSIHFVSVRTLNNDQNTPNYNNDGAKGDSSIAIGTVARAEDEYATSVGPLANTTSFSATAIGHSARAGTDSDSNIPPAAIGAGARAEHDGAVALGAYSLTEDPVATQRIEIAGTRYSFAGTAPGGTASIGRKDPNAADFNFTRTLINLAAGRISADSTDGINGSQLFATNQALESLVGRVNNLQSSSSSVSSSQSDLHFVSVSGRNHTGSYNPTGGNYTNDGAEGYDSIAIGASANAKNEYATAVGALATASNVSATAIGHYARAGTADVTDPAPTAVGAAARAVHANSVALGTRSLTEESVATAGVDIGGTQYSFAGIAPKGTVSIGNKDPNASDSNFTRTLINLAAGRISANSTDGINGSQLFAFQQALEALSSQVNRGSGSSSSSGSGVGGSSGAWTLTAHSRPVTIGSGGAVTFSGDRNIAVTQNGSNDNGQINVALNRDLDLDSVAVGASSLRRDGLRIAGGPSVTSTGVDAGGRKITNVAPGTLNANSTDAVNGSQLFATNRRIDNVIAQGISSGGLSLVQYSDPDTPTRPNGGAQTNDVTLVGGDSTRAVTVHNVAAGRNATDAVNVTQLNRVGNRLNDRIDNVDERASRGIASSMAGAGLPQAYLPGKSMVAAATANYRGEQALAIGASTISDNGKWIIKGTINANRKDAAASFGLGYQW